MSPQNTPEFLDEIDYPFLHETAVDDIISDFYTPSLTAATEYKRAVGYLTSSWFAEAAEGMANLAASGGTAKWIISPKLSKSDWESIKKGDAAKRDKRIYTQMEGLIDDLEDNLRNETQNTLAWLIADGYLRIKIAVTENSLSGDFHDKWGIFIDNKGQKVAFHGSQNDSKQSLSNYEANSIFTSWRSDIDAKRVEEHEERFDSLWENSKQGVYCFDLPDSISLGIAELRNDDRPYNEPDESQKIGSPHRWRHQKEAVDEFLAVGSGILDMATGTGKTRTSLKIIDRLLRTDEIDSIVIATYGNDLLNQWNKTILKHFSTDEMLLYRQYGGSNELGSYLMTEATNLDILLTSYSNLSTAIKQDSLGKLSNALLVCDEVHNIGAQKKRKELSGELTTFPYRLGLSATPFNPYNEDRNDFIREEIGPVVYEFTLQAAIERGILCEFDYIPLEYELSEEDKEKQKNAYSKFAGMKRNNPNVSKNRLYILLSKVRKESAEKLPIFKNYLNDNPEILDQSIIFVETKDFGLDVQKIIYDYIDGYHTYYGEDDEENLSSFSKGELSTLVTSRAISEGIDIQSVKNIILFTAPRSKGTTVQRIGRALRKNPNNPSKTASILDFVVGSDIREQTVDSAQPNQENGLEPPDKERYNWLKELSNVEQSE